MESGVHFIVAAVKLDSCAIAYGFELKLSKRTTSLLCLGEIKLTALKIRTLRVDEAMLY